MIQHCLDALELRDRLSLPLDLPFCVTEFLPRAFVGEQHINLFDRIVRNLVDRADRIGM